VNSTARGRKSPTSISKVLIPSSSTRSSAPSRLSNFRATDLPLLTSLVQATLLAREAGRDAAKLAEFERAARLQATLATKLRLTPQARMTPRTVGRHDPRPMSYYETEHDSA
jgi:hypothetical protein